MRRLIWSVPCILCFCPNAWGATPTPGQSARILSPRFFPGWQSQNVCYPFVVRDEQAGNYRMYYAGSGSEQWNESVADQWMTGYVTSADTLAWSYPDDYEQVLFARKLYEADLIDPVQNEAIFDSVHATGTCVIRDGSLWKAWYTGWNGQIEHIGAGISKPIHFRVGHATSPNGRTWTTVPGPAGAGSVLGLGEAGQPDRKGAAHPHVLKEGSTYRMWYDGYDGSKWRIMYATSADGINWTRRGLAIDVGGAGARDEIGARNPLVLTRNGHYELWYQGNSASTPAFHVLRATGPDGQSWTKAAQEVVLHPGGPIADDERILVDSAIVLPDGAVQVFFARQITSTDSLTNGSIRRRSYHIYTEVVNP